MTLIVLVIIDGWSVFQICAHPYAKLREWGATGVTTLVKAALSAKNLPKMDTSKLQALMIAPLMEMCEVGFDDARQMQIECLMQILQSKGQTVEPVLWPTLIAMLGKIVSNDFK